MAVKYKLRFSENSIARETVLAPLYSRAQCSRQKLIRDPDAEEVLGRLLYDDGELDLTGREQILLALRGEAVDRWLCAFLQENPRARVINLGCGLDSRCRRIQAAAQEWYDLDFPDVIGLRSRFFREDRRYRMIGAPLSDWSWLEDLPVQGELQTVIVAEGFFCRMPQERASELVMRLGERYPGAYLLLGFCSRRLAEEAERMEMQRRVGSYPFRGADTREELEALAPGLRCQKMLRVISQAQLQKLSLLQRVQFRLLDGSGETALRAAVCRLPGGNPPEQTPEEPKTDAEKKPPLP